VTWTAIDLLPVTNLAKSTDGVVGNNQALLPFETGREDADAPKRRQVVAPASATAKVERKELDELLKLVRARLHGAIDEMLGKIKIDLVRSAASTVVYAIVNPVLNELQAELNRLGSGVLTVSGTGTVWVAFHEPEQPTPTPTPEPKPSKKPKPKGDFCGKYREAALWWSKQGGLAAAGEFANRLRAIRSLASPAQRGDLDVMIKIFDLVASGANPGVIGNEVEKNDFPGAGKRLGTTCNVDPSWFQM
jgi:hypothetical protein